MGSLLDHYGWYEWICHSNFSFLVGASHPHEYVTEAHTHGYSGLAFTDYDGVYGLARAYRAHLNLIQKGGDLCKLPKSHVTIGDSTQKPLGIFYGAELHLAKDHHMPLVFQDTVVVIAKSRRGYSNLCRLLTLSHKDGKHDACLPFDDFIHSDTDDLVVIVPMRGLIRRARSTLIEKRWKTLQEKFSKQFYVSLSRHLNPAEDCWIKKSFELASSMQLPILLSQDVYMHDAHQKKLSDVLHAMRHNLNIDNAGSHFFVNDQRCLQTKHTIEKLYSAFSCYEQALKNSRTLAESCEFSLSELRYRYPQEMIPDGFSAQSFLEKLSWQEAHFFYQSSIPKKISDLLHKELNLIRELGFADYFLTIWDIVRWARSQHILCQGRGSAANSAVCFVLGITSVNPDQFDLLFERFMSLERGDPPDIDVDFEHERREEVIQYIYHRYGRHRAAMVANVITFKTKGAIRFTGKAMGMREALIKKATEFLALRQNRRQSMEKIFSELKSGLKLTNSEMHRIPLWAELAERIKGFPRHLGIHSGGFIICEKKITEFVAQEPATMENRTVIQWSKDDIEALGFFKIDILALGMLTAIRKSFELIRNHHQINLDLNSLPNDDPSTYEMISRADTVGVFQIESRAQMSMLTRLKPNTFYDLVIEVAIIRPGPIQGGLIHPFLSRRHGLEDITYAHPKLIPVLKRTLGVPIFQEQVMRIAIEVGDFSPGEADALRRQMGQWQLKGDLGPWIEKLITGMKRYHIKAEFRDQLIGQLKGFAEYGFPESHAVSFALLAYASSYLKCHYPHIFCIALLNSQPMGFYSPHALIRDAIRHGIRILPICVQHSDWLSKVEWDGQKPAVRLGLHLVTSLKETSALKLLKTRNQLGGWNDLDHFLQNCGLYRADLSCLAAADTLQIFDVDRRGAIWMSEAAGFSPYYEDDHLWHSFPKENHFEKIQQDFRSTSTTLGDHPSLVLKKECWCFAVPREKISLAKDLGKSTSSQKTVNSQVFVFGMVLVRQAPPSAKGMVFFTLEDESGFLNLVFTPQTYQRFHLLINRVGFLCVSGEIQLHKHPSTSLSEKEEAKGHSILVKNVYEPLTKRADVIPMRACEGQPPSQKIEAFIEKLDEARNYM